MSTIAKLFVITRADLSLAQQAVQAIHAAIEFRFLNAQEAEEWHCNSNTVCVLEVPDEQHLHTIQEEARSMGVSHAPFREPDLENTMTAIAIGPEGKRFLKHLPLAFQRPTPSG